MRSARNALLLAASALSLWISIGTAARANDKLVDMAKSDKNWVMPGKNYASDNFSPMTQINDMNIKNLKASWSFSTGLLNGHEGAPLVIDGIMYVHTSYPNYTFALDLKDPGRILWQHKPKQDPAARSVACCDLVNRGLAYWPGEGNAPALILKTQLDGKVVALNAKTGEEFWKVENS
ncbi:MAG: PQQ-dependent dehydrogenase, methanol/ethanol family, partial [Bradyrhizobium sp.]